MRFGPDCPPVQQQRQDTHTRAPETPITRPSCPKKQRAPQGRQQPPPPPCVTFRRVVVSLRGPGRSPVLPFACCVGSLRSVGRCGRCSCWCRCRVRGAQWLVCWGCAECGMVCRLRVSGAQGWGGGGSPPQPSDRYAPPNPPPPSFRDVPSQQKHRPGPDPQCPLPPPPPPPPPCARAHTCCTPRPHGPKGDVAVRSGGDQVRAIGGEGEAVDRLTSRVQILRDACSEPRRREDTIEGGLRNAALNADRRRTH